MLVGEHTLCGVVRRTTTLAVVPHRAKYVTCKRCLRKFRSIA